MSYVRHVLQPGEEVRHVAGLHWILYLPGLLVWILAAIILIIRPDASEYWVANRLAVIVTWLCFAVGLVLIARVWFSWWTTEIAVTNRRVIYKKGLVRRETTEMNLDKVETVNVDQSILGRIFDYGNVDVRGTGKGNFDQLKHVAAPLELRNHVIAVEAQQDRQP